MAIVSRLHDGAAWPNWQKGRSREEVIRPISSVRPISHCVATSKRGDHLSLPLVREGQKREFTRLYGEIKAGYSASEAFRASFLRENYGASLYKLNKRTSSIRQKRSTPKYMPKPENEQSRILLCAE